jgi:hypothetical protein
MLRDAWATMTPKPVSMNVAGPGSVSDMVYGADVYAQPLTVQALDAQSNTITLGATPYLVSENGQWRFASAILDS